MSSILGTLITTGFQVIGDIASVIVNGAGVIGSVGT